MCEWCTKQGAGKKWYMNAKYYSAEVAKELDRDKEQGCGRSSPRISVSCF